METYYGVIYFKDGHKVETAFCSGPCADRTCEAQTAREFDQWMKVAVSDFFKPTRYEVKVKNN